MTLVLIGFLVFSCSNDDEINYQITGKWKLTEAKFYGLEGGNSSEGTIDYRNENIIYNFQSNGILIVSGGENAGYTNGEYEYIFGEDYLSGAPSPGEEMILLVKINNSTKWTYNMTNGQMTLGDSYVDGPNLVFEKR